jgi:hypothetical protein
MHTLDDLDNAAASLGGNWVKLRTTDDPPVVGKVLAFEVRPKTFEGQPVLSRKSGQQRNEWVFTLDAGDGGDPIKLSLNEAGQRAVSEALRKANAKPKVGDTLKIRVHVNPEDSRSQATYAAAWEVGAEVIDVPAAGDDEFPSF